MNALDSMVELDEEDLGTLAELRAGVEAKMSRLRGLVPCMLDMSFREATLSSRYGHTLADKIELYELAREFGFTDFGLSNFYDFPSVTDQFLDYLLENDVPLDQFLVTIAIEPEDGSNRGGAESGGGAHRSGGDPRTSSCSSRSVRARSS